MTDRVPTEPRHVQTFRLFGPTSLAPQPSGAIAMQPAVRLQGQLTFPQHEPHADLTSSARHHVLEAPMESRECKQKRIPLKCTNRGSLEQDFVRERCLHAGQFVFAFLNNRFFRKELEIFNQLMNDFCTKILRTYCLFSEDHVNSAVETEPANF